MERVLVIGGDGLIGAALYSFFKQQGIDVHATTRQRERVTDDKFFLDLTNQTLPEFNTYSHVFLCAGITNMSVCESSPQSTYAINVDATMRLAAYFANNGAKILYISSNTVFDGSNQHLTEHAPTCHTTEYGRQKVMVEEQLLALSSSAVIVRITKLISHQSSLFAAVVSSLLAEKPYELFTNLYISPISIDYLLASLHTIAFSDCSGILHISGAENMSYAEFGKRIANEMGLNSALIVPTIGKGVLFSPRNATLDMVRSKQLLNLAPETTARVLASLALNTNLTSTRLDG